jgi:hypothetical protein
MILITSSSKHGDVWMNDFWIGCNNCIWKFGKGAEE